jgi:hypothetical protein
MPVHPPHRPVFIRAINGAGAAFGRLGWKLPSLDPERLERAAIRQAGFDDFGGTGYRRGLLRLVDSLEKEAELTTLGRIGLHASIAGYLLNRLNIERHRQQHPELAQGAIERPLFVVGLPRTGTTILFNLLAQDPRNRAPLSWEVHWPQPPPTEASFRSDPRIRAAEKLFGNYERLVPWLPAIHEFGARLPQECVPIFAHEFLSIQWHSTTNVPSYQAWFESQDVTPAYDFHKRFLQHLQSRYMKERWVLKSPAHLPAIDALLQTYPDACIIHTHRDPAAVMPSLASLYHATRSANSDALDPRRIGAQVLDVWSLAVQRAVDARRRHADKPRQFFDAAFEQIQRDPIETVRRAYAHFGIEWTAQVEEPMRRFLAANPRGSRGVHRYLREDFGLSLDEIRSRFGDYCRAYDIPLS